MRKANRNRPQQIEKNRRRNQRRKGLLGMDHGTAMSRIRKMMHFEEVKMNGRNVCYRCGKKILSWEDFTIEHKEQWMKAQDPAIAFWDMSNLAYSHSGCNSKHF